MMALAPWRSPLAAVRAVAALALALTALFTPGFLSEPNVLSLVTTVSFIGCVAIGMTLITISGNIMSFSLGALVGATAMVFIVAVNVGGVIFAFVAALLFAAVTNGAQGFLVGTVRANPIIVSIAATALIYGVAEAFAESGAIYASAGTDYGIFHGKILGLPIEFVVFLCAGALAQFLLSWTIFGRNLFMTGSSLAAAQIVGVKTWRSVTGAYLWAGLFAGLAGLMLAMRYDSASMTYGIGYEYDAMAAVLVGGTAIKGGEGSAVRTLIGALVIAVIEALLLLWGFRQEWQFLLTGVIVLAVVALQTRGRRD
jgi:ribose/xylose/arabinose/galactoside ABC-type transport system permease subunit